MPGHDASTYGDRWADIYDGAPHVTRLSPVGLVADVLADLAADGPALELAIGTGRVAVPLTERGIDVHGIDASEAMVAKLRDKPGGGDIPVTIGDFADVGVEDSYPLVFVVFNTFFALTTVEDQVRCFANVAAHLTERGKFLIEAFVPDARRFEQGQTVRATHVDGDEVHLEASNHDPVHQRIASQAIRLRDGEPVEIRPIELRYAYPTELDLMARLAGLELRSRWGGWDRSPFSASSRTHISVYARA